MTKVYKEAGGHKKLLVPVVALLLCAFAMVGAGYAFLASTASSTDNSLEGDVISATITGEGGGWVTTKADFRIDYGSYNSNGTEKFYVEGLAQEIGSGTLTIDVKDYKGDYIKIATAADITTIPDDMELGDLEIILYEDNEGNRGSELGSDVVQLTKTEDINNNLVLHFAIMINYTVEMEVDDTTTPKKSSVPIAGGEAKEVVYFLNGANVTKNNLASGFTYTAMFSMFPDDGPATP